MPFPTNIVIHPFTCTHTVNKAISPNVHTPSVAQHNQCPALTPSAASEGPSIFSPLSFFFNLSDYEEEQEQLLQPLFLLALSQGKAIGLAGEEARQIYGGGGDLWGRNTVMGEWLSTVSYWHLTKCPKQNEFTSLFLNHQAATALTPILTAITRSPISQGSEKFTVTSTFQ